MSRFQSLKLLIHQRLTAAVEELFGHLETTISEYEEEVKSRYHKLLDARSRPKDELRAADVRRQLVIKEELPEPVQEQQEDLGGPHIKEEKRDFCGGPGATVSHVRVKSEGNRETEPPGGGGGSAGLVRAAVANGKDCGGADANRTSALCEPDDKTLGRCQAEAETEVRRESDCKSFGCSKCARTFGQRQHLLLHMRCHAAEKPFSCSLCAKTFTKKSNLTKHLTVHTRDRTIHCPVCNEKFVQRGNLTQHMTVHKREKLRCC